MPDDSKFSSLRSRGRFAQPSLERLFDASPYKSKGSEGYLDIASPSTPFECKHASTPTNPTFSPSSKASNHRRWRSESETPPEEEPEREMVISPPVLVTHGGGIDGRVGIPTASGGVRLVRTPSEAVRKFMTKNPPVDEVAPPLPPKRAPPAVPSSDAITPPRSGHSSSDFDSPPRPLGERRWLSPQKAPVLERGHSAPLVLRPQRVNRVTPRLPRSISSDTGSMLEVDETGDVPASSQATTPRAAQRTATTSVSSLESATSTTAVSCTSGGASSKSSSPPRPDASKLSFPAPTEYLPPFAATLLSGSSPRSSIGPSSAVNSEDKIVSLNVGGTTHMIGLRCLLSTPSRLEEWLRDQLEDQGRDKITFGSTQVDASPTRDRGSQIPPYERPANLPSRYTSMTELASALERERRPTEVTVREGAAEPKSVVYGLSSAHSIRVNVGDESPIDSFMPDPAASDDPHYRRRPSSSYTLTPSPKTSGEALSPLAAKRRPSTTAFPQTATSSLFFSDVGSVGHDHSLNTRQSSFDQDFPRTPTDVGLPFQLPSENGSAEDEETEEVLSPIRLLDFGASKDNSGSTASAYSPADDVEAARTSLSPTGMLRAKAVANAKEAPAPAPTSSGPIEVFLDRSATPYVAILHFLRHSTSLPTSCSLAQLLPHSYRLPVDLLASLSPTAQTGPPAALAGQLFELHAKLLELRDEAAWLGMEFLRAVVEAEGREVKRAVLGGSPSFGLDSSMAENTKASKTGWI